MGSTNRSALPLATFKRLLLTGLLGLSSALGASPLVPEDIAFRPTASPSPSTANKNTTNEPASQDSLADTGTSISLPPETTSKPAAASTTTSTTASTATSTTTTSTPATASGAPGQSQTASLNRCPERGGEHSQLHKSLAITAFARSNPQTANAGRLFAVETGLPKLLHHQLRETHQIIGPALIPQAFSLANLNEAQLKQQAQKVARNSRSQFVLSGTIDEMAMNDARTTYNPSLYRTLANAFYDLTQSEYSDKRTRVFSVELELRDGFTGDPLMRQRYSTTGIWKSRSPMGFDSPAFLETSYGQKIALLSQKISADLSQTIHCQPYMAQVDVQPGQSQVMLQGGANNGLQAGTKMQLYQVLVVGSSSDYQVSEVRLVKRPTLVYLSEVYPTHSLGQVEGGSYLNGRYLAVID